MNRACKSVFKNLHEQKKHASCIRPIKNNFVRMKARILKLTWYLFLGTLLFTYCKKDEKGPTQEEYANILKEGGVYNSGDSSTYEHYTLIPTPIDSTINDTTCICSKTHCDIFGKLDDQGSQLLFNDQSGIIYPGNLLQGKTLTNEIPSSIVVTRAGGTISYNLNNGNLISSFSVDQVTKSSIQDAMNNIIHNAGNVVPANFTIEYSEVQSEEQLALKLGLSVKYGKFKMASSLKFSMDKQYNRYLVKLTQKYYTMSFDLPTSYDKIFAKSVTTEELSKYVGSGNPATYISDVTYGRIFYMLIESTESSMKIDAAIAASYSGITTQVAGDVNVSYIKNLKNSTVKVIAYGGDAKGSMELTGVKDISVIADRMAQSTDIRAGLPISYIVRNVINNDVVIIKNAAEYDVYHCESIANSLSDVDGNVYRTLTINGKVWMAENLKVKHYNDGAIIPYHANNFDWVLKLHAYCYYNNDSATYGKTYGCLYNGYAIKNAKLAPKGWHIPTSVEWAGLITYCGGTDYAGGVLKETGYAHWLSPNITTDDYGFKALPGGARNPDGSFSNLKSIGYFWNSNLTYYYMVYGDNYAKSATPSDNRDGFSVRCIKDY
jgi:uncharacterized protein (TIGR02145 family)